MDKLLCEFRVSAILVFVVCGTLFFLVWLRTIETNFSSSIKSLPQRWLPPGNIKMLYEQWSRDDVSFPECRLSENLQGTYTVLDLLFGRTREKNNIPCSYSGRLGTNSSGERMTRRGGPS